jgi:predicted 3-demethylubiquinone-9 3-methyltransferase (glyoxalase superfamily)
MKKITPFLWFDSNAEEAMNFYVSVFKDSKIKEVSRYPENSPGPAGQVMVATFELFGQDFMALNGGPEFKFNESISFVVDCDGQEEVDYYWNKLTADGGEESQCGWLKDKFGLSWQIVPKQLNELMSNPDPAISQKAMQAMLQMKKIEIDKLQ